MIPLKRFCRNAGHTVAKLFENLAPYLKATVFFAKMPASVPGNSIVFFPVFQTRLCCGIAGIVSYRPEKKTRKDPDAGTLENLFSRIRANPLSLQLEKGLLERDPENLRSRFLEAVRTLKQDIFFPSLLHDEGLLKRLSDLGRAVSEFASMEKDWLAANMGALKPEAVEYASRNIEILKDVFWTLLTEIAENGVKVKALLGGRDGDCPIHAILTVKKINAVLNSIDRLEVRGRDSAGISLMVFIEKPAFEAFQENLKDQNLSQSFRKRMEAEYLSNQGIACRDTEDENGNPLVCVSLTYKVAAEIGKLGDNVRFLRDQIQKDPLFFALIQHATQHCTILCHTRWASIGAITEANCHPVDNRCLNAGPDRSGIIHVCLNGDIDNYLELKSALVESGISIHPEVTTDTKIIPLQIQHHLKKGLGIAEAFRLAVNDFEGSHAIAMHTDLAPGKLFLAQRGSGQALFVGISPDHYMPTSEVYGFVEETSTYVKLEGEKTLEGQTGKSQGQIFILDQAHPGGLTGISAMGYDGTPLPLSEADLKTTDITSRDIDRQDFSHYFLKEISESPRSVEQTLQNRWEIPDPSSPGLCTVRLEAKAFPEALHQAFAEDRIRRIFFIGQGTAGVAAAACAEILGYYLNDSRLQVSAMKASELSGFRLVEESGKDGMADSLVVAITQSGTTTDTNRTVDMVRERGARTLAIVNRRDSDITFKVDGVLYTSSGRDIEMSVASTKAFYSQIVAGALLGLHIAALKKRRDAAFVSKEIQELLRLPEKMDQVLSLQDPIAASASRLASTKTYWAAVGSGPNKVSADEIRIKLSELCYKTISSDFVEDKKHIDLSSEPLIIVCAAGAKNTVIGDIVKDTAIFHAHKATPVVIADEGEHRFDPYAADVFHVPVVGQHLAPILNTLVGHIWGYYAALTINEGSRFLFEFRESLQQTIDGHVGKGLDIYELVLDKTFREQIAFFYNAFRKKMTERRLSSTLGFDTASELPLLLKYLSGRLPVTDFEFDFGSKGTAANMLRSLFHCLGESINQMARPVDAIKHQAKTVTVGTSRIPDRVEGILFDALFARRFTVSQITNKNVIVLRNLQAVILGINGSTLYRIHGLNLLGEPTEETTIELVGREGSSLDVRSRVEKDSQLKGTKRIIVQEGNVLHRQGTQGRPKHPHRPHHLPCGGSAQLHRASLPLRCFLQTEGPHAGQDQGSGRQIRTHPKHRPREQPVVEGHLPGCPRGGGSVWKIGGKDRGEDRRPVQKRLISPPLRAFPSAGRLRRRHRLPGRGFSRPSGRRPPGGRLNPSR